MLCLTTNRVVEVRRRVGESSIERCPVSVCFRQLELTSHRNFSKKPTLTNLVTRAGDISNSLESDNRT